MGNRESIDEHVEFKEVNTEYQLARKYNDIRFGEVRLLSELKINQKICEKIYTTTVKREMDEITKLIRSKRAISHPNLLKILGYNSKREEVMCGDLFKISMFYEAFEFDLSQDIVRRRDNAEIFQEKELWFLLDCIVSACAYL